MARYTASRCTQCDGRVWLSSEESGVLAKCRRCIIGLSECHASCEICFNPVWNGLRYANISNESWENNRCSHSGHFCRACLYQYVQTRLSDGCWNIRCPGERCHYSMLEADIKRILEFHGTELGPESQQLNFRDAMHRYTQLRNADYGAHLRAVLRMQERATTAENDNLMTSQGDQAPRVSNASESVSCAPSECAFDKIGNTEVARESDTDFSTWALESCQACPRCLVIIRKETGCDHVNCRCGTSFCYQCGAPAGQCICRSLRKLPAFGGWLRTSGELEACA